MKARYYTILVEVGRTIPEDLIIGESALNEVVRYLNFLLLFIFLKINFSFSK